MLVRQNTSNVQFGWDTSQILNYPLCRSFFAHGVFADTCLLPRELSSSSKWSSCAYLSNFYKHDSNSFLQHLCQHTFQEFSIVLHISCYTERRIMRLLVTAVLTFYRILSYLHTSSNSLYATYVTLALQKLKNKDRTQHGKVYFPLLSVRDNFECLVWERYFLGL